MSARMLQAILLELFPFFAFSYDEDEDFYGDGFYGVQDEDEIDDEEDNEDEDGGNWFDNEDEWDNY